MVNAVAPMSVQSDIADQFIAELLIAKAERQLQEAIEDFGYAFVSHERPQIIALIQSLQQAIAAQDEAVVAMTQFALNDVLGNLTQRANQRQQEEEAYWAETYWD
jgi:alpha-D-ribose 1-methylphosphonate 5-triphosphate synthase subunit PhnG